MPEGLRWGGSGYAALLAHADQAPLGAWPGDLKNKRSTYTP